MFIVTESAYSVYLVRCRDGSLYTGIATDVDRRLKEHQDTPRGAKFLRGKGPLELVFRREVGDRSVASRIEHAIKRLPAHEKSDQVALTARIESVLTEIGIVSKE